MPPKSKWLLTLVISSSVLAYVGLAYFTPRTHFGQLSGLLMIVFAGYYLLISKPLRVKTILYLAIAFRLIFLFSYPRLSDDYFRFIWDGTLLNHGENPYLHLPAYYLLPENSNLIPALTQDFYQRLNSPQYYSVYPPVCQAIFGLANYVGGSSFWLNCFILRLFILLAELGSLFCLSRILRLLHLPQRQMRWYALNPLIIIELTGNLHPEAWLIFFLLFSFYLLLRDKKFFSAVLFGLAVGVKLWPLLFLPLVWRRLGFKAFLGYGTVVGLVVVALFFPFLSPELISNILNSINLYFQKFEFNASLYYLFRLVGFRLYGYNDIARIGPLLSLITVAGILYLALGKKIKSGHAARQWWELLLISFTLYLVLATVVHPWYITTLVALATCSRWRYPLVWSAVAFLSYATYRTSAYSENLWLTALEYIILFGFILYEYQFRLAKPQVETN
ncbi:hypothetical protein AAE02nite_42820 [Adhaeribacter aerolatus]|uniref:DUF2029 domain-containing protein n=1 Tax=Adhaeribacter aerolatus TaxID=670289 RepID=A0A512B3T6_9BACT|nr:glycosyltransferase 87 family protein [Adhaeribacter aerolatus]GEO06618.1 hypothetical protein AAE02nite_42820 [Adhaeribacter aerolatus]